MQAHGSDDGQRNALVGRSEDNVKIQAKVVMNGTGIIQAQLMELISRNIGTGVHKKGRRASALKRKLAKFKYVTFDHKLNKFLLVVFHGVSLVDGLYIVVVMFAARSSVLRVNFSCTMFHFNPTVVVVVQQALGML